MPCNTVTTQTIALAKALPTILMDALKSAGWDIPMRSYVEGKRIDAYKGGATLTWIAGKGLEVRSSNPQPLIAEVTKAYSKQAVTWAAQRAGWQVQQTADNKLTVTRR